jgi:hypothetical protein
MFKTLVKGCFNACFSLQNFAEDKLREELRKLQEDKCQYQGTAKESLRKLLQEKLEAVQKMQDLERYGSYFCYIVQLWFYKCCCHFDALYADHWTSEWDNKAYVTNQWQSLNSWNANETR